MAESFRIPKTSGTYADALLAFGLACLLDRWLAQQEGDWHVILRDAGTHYEVSIVSGWGPSGEPLDLDNARYFASPAPYLLSQRFRTPPEERFPTRNVDEVWQQVRTYAEQRTALSQEGIRGTDAEQQLRDLEPPPDWQVVAFLGDGKMQALSAYNRIVEAWPHTRNRFPRHFRAFLSTAQAPEAFKEWRKTAKADGIPAQVTATQLLNPHQGKGQNQAKIGSIQPGNLSNPWPLEYLKAVGLWEGSFPRQTVEQDWKLYILAPRQIALRNLRGVYSTFSRLLWRERRSDTTSLKTDITSILLFYRAWMQYVVERRDEDDFDASDADPATVVHGFYVTQFKRMSAQAYTMLNQSFLRLPEWGKAIRTWEDVKAWQELIEEHLNVVHSIDENHSDGFELLKSYRDFVAGGRWEAFFDFVHGYAHYVMSRLAQNQYAALFTTSNLRRLLMIEKKFSEIVDNEGFQNFAYAIRHSTVIPQSRKARNLDILYEIRYGLGAELKRKATVKEEFLTALMDFAHSYNRENAQVLERTGNQMRKDLRTTDIKEITRLVDEYGSEVVAHLLVAYGYAREPREEQEELPAETEE